MLGDISAAEVDALSGIRYGVTFVDGGSTGDTVADVEHYTSYFATSVQTKYSRRLEVQGRYAESLEKQLCQVYSIVNWV